MTSLPAPSAAEALVRIEVKLDLALKAVDDHEGRIRALEARSWPKQSVTLLMTGVSTTAAVIAVLAPLLLH